VSSTLEARTALRQLAAEAGTVVKSARMNPTQKKARLDGIEVEMKAAKEIIEMHEAAGRLMVGGSSIDSGEGGFVHSKGIGAPGLLPSGEQMHELFDAVRSHKSVRMEIGTKAGVGDLLPDRLVPGVVGLNHEPSRLLEHLSTSSMDVPVVEYIRHLSTTGAAGMTAAGALKPAATLNVDKVEARARKLAVTTVVNDEDLADFTTFQGYVAAELARMVIDLENAQLIAGDGIGENLLGLLNQTGILTRLQGTDTGLDALEQGFTDLRVGGSFVAPTIVVLNPATWSKLRRAKDTQGRYLVAPDPTATEASTLWGVPVLQTTQIAAGTALALNAEVAAQVFIRQGIVLQTDYGQTGFEKNQTAFRCESRLALAVPRPSAVLKVTGL